jgi:lipopolysaccharide transport system ATP-binding protein
MSCDTRPVIAVRHVSKRFRRYQVQRPWTLQEALQRGLRRIKPAQHFWSLQDVNVEVLKGRALGIIGPNGAGKSTLLRLVAGIGRPDQGSIEVRGRVGALLDLGAGFHPELTGRENVFVSGVIGGLTRREVQRQFDSIVDFSELHEFIDSPLHTYSTGMQVRLAFATAIHAEPQVLLVDEVLSVGDLAFQTKCLQRVSNVRARGCTILLVTHDLEHVRMFCDDALLLRGGKVVCCGASDAVVAEYLDYENGRVRHPRDAASAIAAISQ